jgi:hypothetical protein
MESKDLIKLAEFFNENMPSAEDFIKAFSSGRSTYSNSYPENKKPRISRLSRLLFFVRNLIKKS